MHIAAALDPDVSNRRIHAWSTPFNWNDVLAIIRDLYPEKTIIEDLPNMGKFMGTVDDSLGLELMKRWGSQDGWTSLEEGIRQTVENQEQVV